MPHHATPMPGAPARVLVTGATGVVGTELVTQLRTAGDAAGRSIEVIGCSSRGDGAGVVAWRLGGGEPCPATLRGPWDAIVHCAASTRWNGIAADSWRANVVATEEVLALADPGTHVIHVSTAYATGLRGDVSSEDREDYRNTYEWSKAAAERVVGAHRDGPVSIVRPPLVIGRSTDGAVARFNGMYTLTRAMLTGLAPAVVGHEDARVEIVAVDHVAALLVRLVLGGPEGGATPHVLGAGADAIRLDALIAQVYRTLNGVRAELGEPGLDAPPIVDPDRWDRLYLPFLADELSATQWRIVDLLTEFRPYLSMREPLAVTEVVPPTAPVVDRAIRHWLATRPAFARTAPRPWVAAGDAAVSRTAHGSDPG